jgi:hypothetical protein
MDGTGLAARPVARMSRKPWHHLIPSYGQRMVVLEELTHFWLTQWEEHPDTQLTLV